MRNLLARGEFVLHDYRDAETLRPVESNKKKLILKDSEGVITEYFIIPLKTPNRQLLVIPEKKEEKIREVWNAKIGKSEPV